MTARMAAESLLARGVLELRQRESYGQTGETLSFRPNSVESGTAVLTFNTTEAKRQGVPVSVNNLGSDESRPGADGDVIPARTARVYALGTYQNERRLVAIDLHIPPYPYAVATDGTFASLGDLTLTGLSPETGKEVPGHLVANSESATSVMLGANTEIAGDVISAGGINLHGDNIVVKGQVRAFEAPTATPKVPLRDYDPRTLDTGSGYSTMGTSYYRDTAIEGKVLRVGDLQLAGNISLDGALLYVDGNLEISGALAGRGAIICTGDVEINGTQSLSADNELALLAGGSLSMQGQGINSSRLEGLIYSEGDVTVRDSTIQGTLISHANGTTSPSVVMERAALIHDPNNSSFSVDLKGDPTPSRYLFVREDGEMNKLSATSNTGLGSEYISVGIAPNLGGGYLLFPTGGGQPVELTSVDEMMSYLYSQLQKELGNGPKFSKAASRLDPTTPLRNRDGWYQKNYDGIVATLGSLTDPKGANGSSGSNGFQLNIDPMKFLKYGERIKLRSIRVLPQGASKIG